MPRIAAGWYLKRRRCSPYWYVYFTLNGEEVRRSTGIPLSDEPRARREAAAIVLRETERQGRPAGRGGAALAAQLARELDLKTLSDAWLDELAETQGKKVSARAETDMLHYVETRFSHPAEITSDAWTSLTWNRETRTAGALHHSQGGPLKWRSIAHLANTLRHFLRYCHSRGVIASVPELKSPPTKMQKAERAPLLPMDEEQREAFLWALAFMGETRALRVYTVLFETWQRKRTIECLTPRWCDFKREVVTIPAEFIKGRKEKVIDLTPRAAEAIHAELDSRQEPIGLDEPIFGHFDFHQAWGEEKKGGVFGRALELAGIDRHGLTPHHSTRRTALTLGGQSPDASLSGLMAQAGIDSASVVEVYLRPQLKAARRITRSRTISGQ